MIFAQWLLYRHSVVSKLHIVYIRERNFLSKLFVYYYLLMFVQHVTPVIVVLEPGDVLFIPRHWWHYVESLETSISINTWIELVRGQYGVLNVH